jgi:hypothetical protein
MLALDVLGAVILTYFVSRITLLLAKGVRPPRLGVFVAHLAAWLLIAGTLGLLRSNSHYPFAADAGLIYLLPQALWLLFDSARLPERRSSGSSRRKEARATRVAARSEIEHRP